MSGPLGVEELLDRVLPYVGGLVGVSVLKYAWTSWAEWRVAKAAQEFAKHSAKQTRILQRIDRKLRARR